MRHIARKALPACAWRGGARCTLRLETPHHCHCKHPGCKSCYLRRWQMCATFTWSKLYQQPLPNYQSGNWTWEECRCFGQKWTRPLQDCKTALIHITISSSWSMIIDHGLIMVVIMLKGHGKGKDLGHSVKLLRGARIAQIRNWYTLTHTLYQRQRLWL